MLLSIADPAASSSPSGPTRWWPRRPTPSSPSLRRNGTLGKRVTIWVVSYEDDLYVRSWKGRTAAWYRAIQVRHEGRIRARGIEEDVTFVDGDHDVDDALDAAYRDRTKEEVASDLPPNQHSLISCTLTREQAGLYRRYVDRESRRGTAAGLRALKQRPRADAENPPYARAASVRRPWM